METGVRARPVGDGVMVGVGASAGVGEGANVGLGVATGVVGVGTLAAVGDGDVVAVAVGASVGVARGTDVVGDGEGRVWGVGVGASVGVARGTDVVGGGEGRVWGVVVGAMPFPPEQAAANSITATSGPMSFKGIPAPLQRKRDQSTLYHSLTARGRRPMADARAESNPAQDRWMFPRRWRYNSSADAGSRSRSITRG